MKQTALKINPAQAAMIIALNDRIEGLTKDRDLAINVAIAGLIVGQVSVDKVHIDGTVLVTAKAEKID